MIGQIARCTYTPNGKTFLLSLFRRGRSEYHERVIQYFENPPNVGSLKKKNPNVGTGVVGSMACGDQLKFQIEVDDTGVITDAVFKAFGCGSAIASSSYATELIKGKHIDEAAGIKNSGMFLLKP